MQRIMRRETHFSTFAFLTLLSLDFFYVSLFSLFLPLLSPPLFFISSLFSPSSLSSLTSFTLTPSSCNDLLAAMLF